MDDASQRTGEAPPIRNDLAGRHRPHTPALRQNLGTSETWPLNTAFRHKSGPSRRVRTAGLSGLIFLAERRLDPRTHVFVGLGPGTAAASTGGTEPLLYCIYLSI